MRLNVYNCHKYRPFLQGFFRFIFCPILPVKKASFYIGTH